MNCNDALSKLNENDLTDLRMNKTAVREFLEYHIVRGSYYSGDLKDSQHLESLCKHLPIRMSVIVDGCHRRLAEANNSPLYRADIPASNGVIHVVDWILKPDDLNWCENVILP
ncbi:hypothetical protein LAZ67_13001294 [Cordylochernes scorpioides]|uniref:FAS1 domain-containing protein n=1 Tax=Cordylochernes scorpioides TaxID=51811 RepID=A0ABY6L4I1_9ARAC|nr:hypothetical protein LAZ67_13001294 [Cordylochernes scorpioides]